MNERHYYGKSLHTTSCSCHAHTTADTDCAVFLFQRSSSSLQWLFVAVAIDGCWVSLLVDYLNMKTGKVCVARLASDSLYVHPTIHTYWRWDGGTVLRGCGFIRQPSPRQSPLFYDFSSVLIKCIFFFFFINVKLILVYCILRKSSSFPATSPAVILSPHWTELELD